MLNNYNPDVLSCIANLSNDEIFTPPNLAIEMLDLLPAELWSDPNATFLDPVTKSGVFLREITKRLIVGLESQIPDLQERINHILTKQVFGIAITELTSLLTRRSVYCSKIANHEKYSICTDFNDEQGNISFKNIQHTFLTANGKEATKCLYCGASKAVYDRGDTAETYAYNFIHTENPTTLFKQKNMRFDVIIGNPPYQLSDDGGRDSSAIPLYHKFIQQAKKLNPRYLIMIVPARWYSGGKGLDEFRNEMLNDNRISEIHDFPETKDCFPSQNIRGGICYFLWDSTYFGACTVINHFKEEKRTEKRPLLENGIPVFIRYNQAISILRKVRFKNELTFEKFVSSRKPFGLESNFCAFKKTKSSNHNIVLYRFGEKGYVSEEQILNNQQLIKRHKVFVSKASPGGDEYPHSIVSQPIISEPNSVCTETYLIIKDVDNKQQAENLVSYIKTRFFRFMMSLVKNTQNISKSSYMLVPLQDFSKPWTDEELYAKYGLNEEEIAFIESMIKPME